MARFGKARMKTALSIICSLLFFGCAAEHRTEPAASAASQDQTAQFSAAPRAPEPAPPPAAAPQGLDQPKSADGAAPADDQEQFSTVEAAERALARAKSDFDRLAMNEPPAPAPAAPAPATAPEKSAPRSQKKDRARASAGAAEATGSAPSNPCENACRALSSMSRAANAVCRLDGESGAHCTHAKQVVTDSQRRITSCVCPTGGSRP